MGRISKEHVTVWHDELAELDERIAALQEHKKQVYSKIRRDFDRRTAEGMKVCMRLAAMDGKQRAERLQFDELGITFLNMIKPGEDEALADHQLQADNDDWKKQRERDRATGFEDEFLEIDPETGEINDAA